MRSTKLLAGGAAVFLLLVVAAVIWDSRAALASAKREIDTADQEVKLQEERFLRLLQSIPQASHELAAARAQYDAAGSAEARRKAFSDLETVAQKTVLLGADASNPLQRRLADEVAGTLNRRDIAMRSLQDAITSYNELAAGWRGSLARSFDDLPERIE